MAPNGSNVSTELVNPCHGIYATVTRTNRLDGPEGGWHVEKAITREEALCSFTNWFVYAEFDEDTKSSLEVGKLADFAVIGRDLMTCLAEYIKNTQVLPTVSRGEKVYHKGASVPTVIWSGLVQSFNNKLVAGLRKIWVPLNDIVNGIGTEECAEGSSVLVTPNGKSVKLPVRAADDVGHVTVCALFEGLGRNVTWYVPGSYVSVGWLK